MEAYMEARTLIQEMCDDFLGYYSPALNHLNNALLIKPGLPGGMMGSLMTDLEDNLASLNKWKKKNGQPELTTDQLLVKLFDEVAYVWPKVGYPTLVTPFSQYVKNLALTNVMQMEKGRGRWTMIADNIWDMILGKAGKLPGNVDPEIIAIAAEQGREFMTTDPQLNYPDDLDVYREKMRANGWPVGEDEEELFEYSMHPAQYEAFKSGKAKADFLADLEKRKAAEQPQEQVAEMPRTITVSLNGQNYKLNVGYGDEMPEPTAAPVATGGADLDALVGEDVTAPIEGKFYRVKDAQEVAKYVGDKVKKGDILGYIEAMKTYNAIRAEFDGTIVAILFNSGDPVEEDDVIIKIAKG